MYVCVCVKATARLLNFQKNIVKGCVKKSYKNQMQLEAKKQNSIRQKI